MWKSLKPSSANLRFWQVGLLVVLAAGPASHPIGEFEVDLKRPRDVAEVRTTPRFIELHQAIWSVLREEVLKGYRQQLAA